MRINTTLTFQQKKELFDEYQRRKNQGENVHQVELAKWAKEHFSLNAVPSQATISRLLKRQEQNPVSRSNFIHKRDRVGKNHLVEQALFAWVEEQEAEQIGGVALRKAAVDFQTRINDRLPPDDRVEMKFSNGWLSRFQSRWGVKLKTKKKKNPENDPGAQTVLAANENVLDVHNVNKELEKFELRNIWSAGRFGLFFRMAPSKMISRLQLAGSNKEKNRLVCMTCCNADGSEKLPIMFVGKDKKPASFSGKTGQQLGLDYRITRKASMTKVLFYEWLQTFDRYIRKETGRKVLLLVGMSQLDKLPVLQAVKVLFLPSSEPKLYPLSHGVIDAVKIRYRKLQMERVLDLSDCNMDDVYKLNQLTAMRWIANIWNDLDPKLVVHCWREAGVVEDKLPPDSGEDELIPVRLEKDSLTLMISQVVGNVDRMPIDEFLYTNGEQESPEELPQEELIETIVNTVTGTEEAFDDGADAGEMDQANLEDVSEQLETIAAAKIVVESNFPSEKALLKCLRRVQGELRRKKVDATAQFEKSGPMEE